MADDIAMHLQGRDRENRAMKPPAAVAGSLARRRVSALLTGGLGLFLTLWHTTCLASQMAAGDERRFELLYESLAAASWRYGANVISTATLLVFAIGWMISSGQSREYFRQSALAYRAVLSSISAVYCIHILLSLQTLRASQATMAKLMELDYVEPEYYAGAEITVVTAVSNLALTTALFVALFMLVFSVRTGSGARR